MNHSDRIKLTKILINTRIANGERPSVVLNEEWGAHILETIESLGKWRDNN